MNKGIENRSGKRPGKFFVPFFRKYLTVCLAVCVMGCLAACGKTDLEKEIADNSARINAEKSNENTENTDGTGNRGKTADGKQIITLGTVGVNLNSVENAVNRFNRDNENYEIQIVNYTEGYDYNTPYELYNEAYEKFKLDMATGKGADIIDLSYYGFGPKLSMQKGIVEDLYPYLESSETVDVGDLNVPVLKLYEVDGKLPCFPTNFTVGEIYMGKTSEVGSIESWTPRDVIAMADSLQEGKRLFYSMDKMGALGYMMSDRESYFDRLTGECYFDSEEFKQILEFANRFPDEDASWHDFIIEDRGVSPTELFVTDKMVFKYASIGNFTDVQVCMEGLSEDEELTFIGGPSVSGQTGTGVWGSNLFGIYSRSQYKQGAWEFIEMLQTDFCQLYMYGDCGFPLRNSAYEQMLSDAMKPNLLCDADGNVKEVPKEHYAQNHVEMDIYAVTQEEADFVKEMISRAVRHWNWSDDEEIWNIIEEEAGAYFAGQKSVDDVANIIQNRVRIYVMEQM